MMSMTSAAERIAGRVQLGFDPFSILMIVLPRLLRCLLDNDDINETQVAWRVRDLNKRNPRRLRHRVANNIVRKDRSISRSDALTLASAIVDETLATDDSTVNALAAQVGEVHE